MPGPFGERCSKCYWWDPLDPAYVEGDAEGLCRVNPPEVHVIHVEEQGYVESEARTVWPTTIADDWCGRFQKKQRDRGNGAPRTP